MTIDDLDALMTLLREGGTDLEAGFDGGFFDEAEDLRRMSDSELMSLRLTTPDVQVVLSPLEAVAVGDASKTDHVYRTWARGRQTQRKGPQVDVRRTRRTAMVAFSALLIIPVFNTFIYFSGPSKDVTPVFAGIITGCAATLATILLVFRRSTSYALIVPLSLAEYRQTATGQQYPRRAWIIATISALIAAGSLALLLWNRLNPPTP